MGNEVLGVGPQPQIVGAGGRTELRNQPPRKSRIAVAISAACVSSAKCPVSKKRTSALGISRLKASAPGGRKKGSNLPAEKNPAKSKAIVSARGENWPFLLTLLLTVD